MLSKIDDLDLGIPRDFSDFEVDLWTAVNRIVHHHKIDPVIFAQTDFYRAENKTVAGHLLADLKVTSDRGVSKINVAGFAIACVNELGVQSVTPRRIIH